MERKQLLDSKAKEIEQLIATWVEESAILRPGEQIVFSMHIDTLPTVRRQDLKSTLDFLALDRPMSVKDSSRYKFIRPAHLTPEIIAQVLSKVPRTMYLAIKELLEVHENRPTSLRDIHEEKANKHLTSIPGAICYRLTGEWVKDDVLRQSGLYKYFQLWEVERR